MSLDRLTVCGASAPPWYVLLGLGLVVHAARRMSTATIMMLAHTICTALVEILWVKSLAMGVFNTFRLCVFPSSNSVDPGVLTVHTGSLQYKRLYWPLYELPVK